MRKEDLELLRRTESLPNNLTDIVAGLIQRSNAMQRIILEIVDGKDAPTSMTSDLPLTMVDKPAAVDHGFPCVPIPTSTDWTGDQATVEAGMVRADVPRCGRAKVGEDFVTFDLYFSESPGVISGHFGMAMPKDQIRRWAPYIKLAADARREIERQRSLGRSVYLV